MSSTKYIECGNCGCVFDPKIEDLDLYWMDGPYVDCPNCGSYNHAEMQAIYRCDDCGKLSRKDESCDHKGGNDYAGDCETCHICGGFVLARTSNYKDTRKGFIHLYCEYRKEKAFTRNLINENDELKNEASD